MVGCQDMQKPTACWSQTLRSLANKIEQYLQCGWDVASLWPSAYGRALLQMETIFVWEYWIIADQNRWFFEVCSWFFLFQTPRDQQFGGCKMWKTHLLIKHVRCVSEYAFSGANQPYNLLVTYLQNETWFTGLFLGWVAGKKMIRQYAGWAQIVT